MNTQEVIAKLNKYKEMLEGEVDADIKSRYASKISQLEASLKEAEQKVEKLEEKVATEEKKELSEAEKKIKKYQDYLDGETDPDLKTRYQKKIKELQDSLKEVKEEIKEEKKEVAEQKVEIKKAIKAVKSAKATKVEKKEAIEKVEKKVRERKEVSVKRTRRSKEIKRIISDLDKLIEKNKKLKQKYFGKGVDVKKDAARSAKPFGYRFAGKHDYRVPTKAQIKDGKASGKVVYEGRANRSDVFPQGQKGKSYAKLADGGEVEYTKKQIIYVLNDVGYEVDDNNFDELAINEGFKYKDGVWYRTDDFAKGGKTPIIRTQFEEEEFEYGHGGMMGNKYTIAEAKKMLDAEKSKNENFSWFVPDVDYEGEDYDQEYGVHLSDKGLLELADEIYKKGGKTSSEWDEKMKTAKDTLAFLKKEAENNPSSKMKKSVLDFEEYIKKLNQNKYSKDGKTQGYDDKEDERLAMKYGKMSKKDLDSTYARRDDARFEERGKMVKGGETNRNRMYDFLKDDLVSLEKAIYMDEQIDGREEKYKEEIDKFFSYWNTHLQSLKKPDDAVGSNRMWNFLKDDLIALKKAIQENDKEEIIRFFSYWNTHLKSLEYAKGGRVGQSKEDKARFAKPAGWRWKDSAVKKKIITSAQLSKSPTKAMREKYPNYVYFEDRLNKADKNPSRKYLSA
jgi:hypothetical protein